MGYFDDVKSMLGRGMDAADRKSQELRLQADLSRVAASLESAYGALGKVVYAHPTLAALVQQDLPGEYNGVSSLLEEEQAIRSRIEELRRQASPAAQAKPQAIEYFACTKCGTAVRLDYLYCPTCGDNLAELKQQHRLCPNCGMYLGADSLFCMECGSRTIELPIAEPRQSAAQDVVEAPAEVASGFEEEPAADLAQENAVHSDMPDLEEAEALKETEPETPETATTCPNCGASVPIGDRFCAECGSRVVD